MYVYIYKFIILQFINNLGCNNIYFLFLLLIFLYATSQKSILNICQIIRKFIQIEENQVSSQYNTLSKSQHEYTQYAAFTWLQCVNVRKTEAKR